MLVRITNRCQMSCGHCMVDAQPDGEHMTENVFRAAIEFSKMEAPVLMLSGGEPSEHPDIVHFLDLAKEAGFDCVLLTNGMHFFENPELAKEIEERVLLTQVTNDPRYYPKALPGRLPNGGTVDVLNALAPFGRARSGGLACTQEAPSCFNLRSATRHFGDVRRALAMLRLRGRMCLPSIDVDGIVAVLGTVRSSAQDITQALVSLQCGRCGLNKNLSPEELRAIGENP